MTGQPYRSQRLHNDLGRLIASTQPGERLPSEPKLALQLGVSRATLREAMRTFEVQGFVQRRQGSGTYAVHPPGVLESGLEMLESIETIASRNGLQVSMGMSLVEKRASIPQESASLGLITGEPVISLARVILADERPVAFLVDVLPADILRSNDLNGNFNGSVLDLLLRRGDPPLATSRTDITAVNAPGSVARYLNIQRGGVLLYFIAMLYSSEGRVIDYSQSYFIPGYFRFHVNRKVG